MSNAFNTFRHYGNFEFFAMRLHFRVYRSQLDAQRLEAEYKNFCSQHPLYALSIKSYAQANFLHEQLSDARSDFENFKHIEDLFVSLLSDEAKNSLQHIWQLAERSIAAENRKAG